MIEPPRERARLRDRVLTTLTFVLLAGLAACSGGEPSSNDAAPSSSDTSKPPGDVESTGTGTPADTAALTGAELYDLHCARCHATDGSGKPEIALAIQPRSFKEGGFAWGDTREAIFRVISDGMPGSPFMVPFKHVMTEDQRWLVADHVRTLMPKREVVDEDDRILRVADDAAVVRGHLSPIVDGAPMRPRGMLVGLPGDASLEYRTDDVRLLGLRSGGFVDRSDWEGRGGSTLKPLGELAHVVASGDPGPAFLGGDGQPLRAALTTTHVDAGEAKITYRLEDASGATVAFVDEVLRTIETDASLAVLRRFEMRSANGDRTIRIALDPATPRDDFAHDEPIERQQGATIREDEGSATAIVYRSTHDIERVDGDGLVLRTALGEDPTYLLSVFVVADSWTPARLAAWKETLSI